MLLLAFGLSTVAHYINWQERWVKDRSLMANLARLEGVQRFSVFVINDQFPAGGEDNYRFYEWSSIFKQVWGNECHVGFDQRLPLEAHFAGSRPYFNATYNLGSLDPAGCEAILTIRRSSVASSNDLGLAGRYLFYRYFKPTDLPKFLASITVLQVEPYTSAFDTNCHTR